MNTHTLQRDSAFFRNTKTVLLIWSIALLTPLTSFARWENTDGDAQVIIWDTYGYLSWFDVEYYYGSMSDFWNDPNVEWGVNSVVENYWSWVYTNYYVSLTPVANASYYEVYGDDWYLGTTEGPSTSFLVETEPYSEGYFSEFSGSAYIDEPTGASLVAMDADNTNRTVNAGSATLVLVADNGTSRTALFGAMADGSTFQSGYPAWHGAQSQGVGPGGLLMASWSGSSSQNADAYVSVGPGIDSDTAYVQVVPSFPSTGSFTSSQLISAIVGPVQDAATDLAPGEGNDSPSSWMPTPNGSISLLHKTVDKYSDASGTGDYYKASEEISLAWSQVEFKSPPIPIMTGLTTKFSMKFSGWTLKLAADVTHDESKSSPDSGNFTLTGSVGVSAGAAVQVAGFCNIATATASTTLSTSMTGGVPLGSSQLSGTITLAGLTVAVTVGVEAGGLGCTWDVYNTTFSGSISKNFGPFSVN